MGACNNVSEHVVIYHRDTFQNGNGFMLAELPLKVRDSCSQQSMLRKVDGITVKVADEGQVGHIRE